LLPKKIKILVADAHLRSQSVLEHYLVDQGLTVHCASDSKEMNRLLERENFHLLVLDLMLPGEDGLSIFRNLRQQNNNIPIIMLKTKGDEVDRIIGLELGADDYMPKPFNHRELLARIKAVLRRSVQVAPDVLSLSEDIISIGEHEFNLTTREMVKGGINIPITTGEYSVLKALTTHPREPLSRDKLMNLAHGRDSPALDRSIDVQVSRLRKMLEVDATEPRFIKTVWGFGYVFVPDGVEAI
jgi:two-component system phosphate regulon response regulator OmpR